MNYSYALEKRDISRINKLNALTNVNTFYDDVRKITRNVKSDHVIKRWQCLADARFSELTQGTK